MFPISYRIFHVQPYFPIHCTLEKQVCLSLNPTVEGDYQRGWEIHLTIIIRHSHQENRLIRYFQKVHQGPQRHRGCYQATRHFHHQNIITDLKTCLTITFPYMGPWWSYARVRSLVSVICRFWQNLSTRVFLHQSQKPNSHQIQASSTRGVIIMSGSNMSRIMFNIANCFLGIMIIWIVPDSTWVLTPISNKKSVSRTINNFSLGISTFGSLIPTGSSRFRSQGYWVFLISVAFACVIHQGTVVLGVPFLVTSVTIISEQVPPFGVLRSAISTCLTPFLGFQELVHGQIEFIQITLYV